MAKNIKVAPPQNLAAGDACLFEPFLTYPLPSLKTKKLKGPFVTNSGLVCTNKGLIKECYHDMAGQPDDCLNEVSHYYHAANDNPENLIILDNDETYLLIHHTWHNNYYHWICETLLRLWMVKDQIDKLVLLLPSKEQMSTFALETLEPFSFKSVFYIPHGKSVLVRTLCMPQIKPVMATYNPIALLELNNTYINHATRVKGLNIKLGERLYISRKKSRRRKIINEDEVIAVLKQYNFAVIYNEDYSFFEQVSIYSNAKYLISIHGAGLTNMLFMPPGSTIFELHKRQTNPTDQHSLIFWYMADGLNHKYYQQICEPTDPDEDFFTAHFIVDINLFKKNLELMFPTN